MPTPLVIAKNIFTNVSLKMDLVLDVFLGQRDA
jgi:hypothetical protein